MADSFLRLTLRDGSNHRVLIPPAATPEGLLEAAALGQHWPHDAGWIEVEGGGAVARRLVSSAEVVMVELFQP
jgi:hypothetical protein